VFICERCGYTDNADHNAAKVIKKRAIKLILHSGTELSERGVLLDNGRGAVSKTQRAKATSARSNEASKKKSNCGCLVLEARSPFRWRVVH
jgi:putative transposase